MSAPAPAPAAGAPEEEERFDVLDATGAPTGSTAPRSVVHRDGLFHRAVHVWLLSPRAGELLLQRRAAVKDSWPGWWDISAAGHLSAGQASADAAARELAEELGLRLPRERLRFLHTHEERLASVQRGRPFVNNEFNDVYLVTLTAEEAERHAGDPPAGFTLQPEEVDAVRWVPWRDVRAMYERGAGGAGGGGGAGGEGIVPTTDLESYARLWPQIEAACAAAAAGDTS